MSEVLDIEGVGTTVLQNLSNYLTQLNGVTVQKTWILAILLWECKTSHNYDYYRDKTFLSWKTDELFFTLLPPEPAEGRTASNSFVFFV